MLRLRACSRRLRRGAALGLGPLFLFASCLKTLDESKLDEKKDGGKGGSGADSGVPTDAKDSGKDGSGGTGGGGGDAPAGGGTGGVTPDAPIDAGIVAYDSNKYPALNLANGIPPIVIAADDTYFYRTKKDAPSASFYKHPIAGGPGSVLSPLLERPQAMLAPIGSTYVYVTGGRDQNDAGSQGSLVRAPKGGGSKEEIALGASVELGVGITEGDDGYVYVSFRAVTPAALGLARVSLTSTSLEPLWNAQSGNETGGDIAAAGGCVYWISNGNVGVVTTAGGNRMDALSTPVTDAVGITTDAANFYYTRGDGSVWQRALLPTGCDGSNSPAELPLAAGFKNVGDLVAYDNNVAVSVRGDPSDAFKGGGIFAIPAGGGTIIQIGPPDFGPADIDQGPFNIVYSTEQGTIRNVPKNPVQ